jgi:hypothetical protein
MAEITGKATKVWHASMVEDDDPDDPYRVLTGWAQALSEDYGSERPERWTIANAAAYLTRILHRVAQDDEQDFPLMARELRKCRSHLESVLRDSQAPERGAPCPSCGSHGTFVRLVREYSHWCTDPDCTMQFHSTTDDFDVWVCPRNKDHWWNPQGYADMLKERHAS